MSLDLGALVGHVLIEDTQFQRTYVRVVRQFASLGGEASKSAAGTAKLDDALVGVGGAADKAAAGLGRVAKASAEESATAKKAAVAEQQRAAAIARVAEVMGPLAGATAKDQQAALRDLAAQERLTAARKGGADAAGAQAAATARVASAQASAIGAAERAASSQGKLAGAFAGTVKMAAQLGLLFGAFEAVKKIIDIAHEASDFQRDMLLIQTQAGASAAQVKVLSAAVLGMAGDVAAAPEDLAASLYHVMSIGQDASGHLITTAKAMDIVRIAAEGAKVGNTDLEETTNALTSTVASGISGVKNFSQAMGVLNATVGLGDMRMSDLNDALGTGILARARVFGLTIQEVGASLAVFGDNNIRGADAATQLRMAFQDIAKPAAHADDVLSSIHLTAAQLRDSLEKGGLTGALHLLSERMTTAGITGSRMGGFLEDAFTKKAGAGLAILLTQLDRYDAKLLGITNQGNTFAGRWTATTKTAAFAWESFTNSAKAAGIEIATNLLPDLTAAGQWLGHELPTAVSVLSGALGGPLSAAWTVLRLGFEAAAAVLGPVLSLLDNFKGPLGDVAMLALGVWVAFKVGAAIPGILETIALKAMYMGDAVVASGRGAVTALTGIGTAAVVAGDDVAAGGLVARVGWAGILGPLLAVGVGIGLLVSMFHSSSHASAEAAAAAKAYTDALKSPGMDPSGTILGAVIQQLKDNDVPQLLDNLNKALGRNAFNAGEFADAITSSGKPLDALRSRLESIIKAGTIVGVSVGRGSSVIANLSPAAAAATKALEHLNTQHSSLSKSAAKELDTARQFHMVATSVDEVASAMKVDSKVAQGYLAMLGIIADKNGIVAAGTTDVTDSIRSMGQQFADATQTMDGFLKAWQTFAGSSGTAADRAALIGATLKAANGDALSYAAAINAAAQADEQLVIGLAQAASSVGKHGEKIGTLVDSLVNLKTGAIDFTNAAAAPLISGLQSMQTAAMGAAQAAYQHYRQTENGKRAADEAYKVYVSQTRGSLVDQAKKLGISTTQAGKLADQYFGMPKKVKTLIESEGADPVLNVLNKIGRLLASIFGVPWDAKLTAHADAVKKAAADAQKHLDDVKQKRGIYLHLDKSDYDYALARAKSDLASFQDKTVYIHLQEVRGTALKAGMKASGGSLPEGWSTVGEGGAGARPELVLKRGSAVQVYSNAASKAIVASTGLDAPGMVPGFAAGTDNSVVTRTINPMWSGITGIAEMLKSQIPGSAQAMSLLSRAVNDAFDLKGVQSQLALTKTALEAMAQKVSNLRSGVTGTLRGAVDLTKYGSTTDLLAGLSAGTAANKAYDADVEHAGKLGLSKSLLRQLEASGNTATLDMLGHASKSQIAQINKAYSGFSGSVAAAADVAVAQSGYAGPLAADQARVASLERQNTAIVGGIGQLLVAITQLTGHKAQILLDGKDIAESVLHSPQIIALIDELGHHVTYGRRH